MDQNPSTSTLSADALEQIRKRVQSLSWYHTIDLSNGIVTPGHYDHRPYLRYYGLPQNLAGKTVLDIGAASGFFSFEMERRGASVTAIDLSEWTAHDFGPRYQPDQTPEQARRYLGEPFELAKQILSSRVVRLAMNIYDISPQTIGMFDLVFCGSVLLHLTDPIKGLFNIQSVTKGSAIIATVIEPNQNDQRMACFVGHHRGDAWWLPNRAGLEAMVQSAGFRGWKWISEFPLNQRDGSPGPYHGVIRAWNLPDDLNWPEVLGMPRRGAFSAEDPAQAEIARLRQLVNAYERRRSVRWANALRRLIGYR